MVAQESRRVQDSLRVQAQQVERPLLVRTASASFICPRCQKFSSAAPVPQLEECSSPGAAAAHDLAEASGQVMVAVMPEIVCVRVTSSSGGDVRGVGAVAVDDALVVTMGFLIVSQIMVDDRAARQVIACR